MKYLIILTLVLAAPERLSVFAQEGETGQEVETAETYSPGETDLSTGEPVLSQDASRILMRMTDFISAAPAFSIVSDTGHEVRQKNGQVLEFGSHLTLVIQRPSQANGRFDSRAGDSATTILDGQAIWVYSAKENIYDTTQQTGDIEASLDMLANQLGAPRQLFDFFSNDLTASLAAAVKSGYYVGESVISGVLCDHLALRGEKEDMQVWIARGDEPVPRRIVITYREMEGQPQFWTQFISWDFSPTLSDTTFKFSPPEGSERIHFFPEIPVEDREAENQEE
jgi:hypothetical protein